MDGAVFWVESDAVTRSGAARPSVRIFDAPLIRPDERGAAVTLDFGSCPESSAILTVYASGFVRAYQLIPCGTSPWPVGGPHAQALEELAMLRSHIAAGLPPPLRSPEFVHLAERVAEEQERGRGDGDLAEWARRLADDVGDADD